MKVYFDLDRTLFQTEELASIWDHLEGLYPEIDGTAAYENREEFYVYAGDSYYHDMSAQLESLGLEPAAVYEQLYQTELSDGRFEFEGCKELIESLEGRAEVGIFTYGKDDYQRFKASLCPSLLGLPIVTTVREKSEVLSESEEECWLIDDKPIGDELSGNVSFAQVSLEGKDVPHDAIWPVFRTLGDLQLFLKEVL